MAPAPGPSRRRPERRPGAADAAAGGAVGSAGRGGPGAYWTSTFRFHRRLADTYRTGRVLLAGDAAHIHSPSVGRASTPHRRRGESGLETRAGLHRSRFAALLDSYETERRPVAQEVLASTSGMTRLVMGGSAVARLARDHGLVPLMNRPLVQRLIWEHSSSC